MFKRTALIFLFQCFLLCLLGRGPVGLSQILEFKPESNGSRSGLRSGRGPGLARGAEGRSTCPWFQTTGKWRAEGSSLDLDFGSLPLYFVANRGQSDGRTLFYAKAARYTLWLTEEGLVFDSFERRRTSALSVGKRLSFRPKQVESRHCERDISRLVFLNASKHPQIVPLAETNLKVNYFAGGDPAKWHTDVPTSGAVIYKNVYDRIDLKVYGTESRIEYDWIVRPGGDPRDIRFELRDVKGTTVDEAGNLLIETRFGELVNKKPAAYQEAKSELQQEGRSGNGTKAAVEAAYKKIGENSYAFEVGVYEEGLELIIDPVVLAYSASLGGSGADYGFGIAVDSGGNVYITGYTESTDFPTLNPVQTDQANWDVFVTKIDTTKIGNASLIYSTYLSGNNDDVGNGIAVDGSGYAYITGYTNSTDFPTVNPYQKNAGDGNWHVFVTKLDTTKSGNAGLVYSTCLRGNGNDYGNGIAADGSGKAYVAGVTTGTDFPTLNPYQLDPGDGNWHVFVTKLDTTKSGDASLVYSTYLRGSGSDYGSGIAADGSGKAYVTGITTSSDFPTLNPYQTGPEDGNWHVFVTKLETTKSGVVSLAYSTCLRGNNTDVGTGIAVDGNGKAYVTGYTNSTDFPTLNAYQTDQANWDVFVTKLDTNKSGADSLVFSTYLGGGSSDLGQGIAADGNGKAFVTGVTNSADFPTLNPYQIDQANGDVFVTKLDTTKRGSDSLVYSTYLGGGGEDSGYGIAVDAGGKAYVTGSTDSADFPAQNKFPADPAGRNVFVAKISDAKIYTLTIAAGAGGTTSPGPGTYTYEEGTIVEITAAPSADHRFGSWGGDASGASNPVTVAMNADKTVTANFIRMYSLTIAAGAGGTTSPSPGAYTYDEGAAVSVRAEPSTFYRFDNWTGDASGTANPLMVVMNAPKTIRANFSWAVKAPVGLTGEKLKNRNVSMIEYVARLRWQENVENTGTIRYRVYQIENGQMTLIAEVGGGIYEHIVRRLQASRAYRFGVTAVNSQGWESVTVEITVE